MCDGWESVGDIAARIVAAFGAAGEVGCRSRNVIPFPERGRAPEGAPGQVQGGNAQGGHGQATEPKDGRLTGRPPAGFRAHARN